MLVVIMKAVVQPNMEEHVARGSDIGETKLCQTLQHEVMDLFKWWGASDDRCKRQFSLKLLISLFRITA